MSVRSAVRRRGRRALFLALPVLAAALAPTAAQASWPGLNGWESFSSNRFDTAISGDIFVMPPIGLPQVQLTTARPDDAQSAWSPDGRRIAFKSRRNGNNELYVMNPDGSDQTRLTNSFRVSEGQPAWSPDGTRLLVPADAGQPDHARTPTSGRSMSTRPPRTRARSSSAPATTLPSYSPDGTRILFRGDQDLVDHSGDEELYVMNADGTDVVQLTQNDVFDSAPAFSPDGTKIAFESARDSGDPLALDIYVMNADGTGVRRLTADPAHDEGPIFSPDGTKIAFASLRSGQEDIWVMNADGSGLRRLTDDPARDESPDWQPVPFDMTGHIACGDVGLDRGQASSVAARNAPCAAAVIQARRWAAQAAAGDPPARLRGYACTTAPHTFDLVLVRCMKDEDEPGDPPRDVAFVWRDPAVTLPSGGACRPPDRTTCPYPARGAMSLASRAGLPLMRQSPRTGLHDNRRRDDGHHRRRLHHRADARLRPGERVLRGRPRARVLDAVGPDARRRVRDRHADDRGHAVRRVRDRVPAPLAPDRAARRRRRRGPGGARGQGRDVRGRHVGQRRVPHGALRRPGRQRAHAALAVRAEDVTAPANV